MSTVPQWADSISELQSVAIRAHGHCVNHPHTGHSGEGVKIGIIDSARSLTDSFENEYTINRRYSALDNEERAEDWTDDHGVRVFSILSAYSGGAQFYLYQAVNENRQVPIEAYTDAIDEAISDDIDLLNVSAGEAWRGPIDANAYVRQTKRAIRNDITVVAAAGNQKERSDDLPIHCPSAHENIISVGGLVAECPADPKPAKDTDPKTGPYYIFPDEDEEYLGTTDRPFCGYQECVNGDDCIEHRTEKVWEHNPIPTDGKPDALAPVLYPIGEISGRCKINTGTSYAAPVVSGALGSIFGELRANGHSLPAPSIAREIVAKATTPIDTDSPAGKLNALDLRNRLFELPVQT